jgi:hypothetical protein
MSVVENHIVRQINICLLYLVTVVQRLVHVLPSLKSLNQFSVTLYEASDSPSTSLKILKALQGDKLFILKHFITRQTRILSILIKRHIAHFTVSKSLTDKQCLHLLVNDFHVREKIVIHTHKKLKYSVGAAGPI